MKYDYAKFLRKNYKISHIEEASQHVFEKSANSLNREEQKVLYEYMQRHPELWG